MCQWRAKKKHHDKTCQNFVLVSWAIALLELVVSFCRTWLMISKPIHTNGLGEAHVNRKQVIAFNHQNAGDHNYHNQMNKQRVLDPH